MPAIKLKKAAVEHQAEKDEREKEVKTKSTTNKSLTMGLSSNILFDKRKRTIPPAEKKLTEWMEANLQTKEGVKISLPNLFDYYTEACHLDSCNVVDPTVFRARILAKFGKEFGFQETSAYKGLIKELKIMKKQSVKADSLRLKMKDIIEEAINKSGNPRKGLWFSAIKHYIAVHYPALRVDLRPLMLKSALTRGIRYGHIVLVKGIGMCGYYRLPSDEEPDEEPEKEVKTDEEGEEEEKKENGDAQEGEKKKSKKTSAKRKKADSEGDGEKKDEESTETEEAEEKPKKKKRKHTQVKRKNFGSIQHHDPKSVDDVFPLAMTYMNEPKEASVIKIRKYIDQHYSISSDSLRSALDSCVEKGMLEKVTGKTGNTGSYRLIAEEFDPKEKKNMDDIICCAIIASAEPKQSSAFLLKKYVSEYHENFNIDNRPHVFKHGLERACRNGLITQVSGIGAGGSFKLNSVFTPSPLILAGEADDEDEIIHYDSTTEEKYVPRGTKSRKSQLSRESHQFADFTVFEPPKQKRKPPADRTHTKPSVKKEKKKKVERKKRR